MRLAGATAGTSWLPTDALALGRARPRGASASSGEAGVDGTQAQTETGAKVSLSPEAARALAAGDSKAPTEARDGERAPGKADAGGAEAGSADDDARTSKRGAALAARARSGKSMSASELQVLENLRARDTAVRAHEAAHQAAAGGLGGAAHFDYETGPDGKSYAVSGDVPVQIGGGRNAEERLANANRVMRAALAPADPSAQDRAVAAQAAALAIQAQQEVSTRGRETARGEEPGGPGAKAGEGAGDGQKASGAAAGGDTAAGGARDVGAKSDAAGAKADEAAPPSPGAEWLGNGLFEHSHGSDGCATCGQLTRRYAAAA